MGIEQKEYKNLPLRVGQYIKEYRVSNNFSLQFLSARLGISPTYLRDIERGEKTPDDQLIRNLSEKCGLDENYIFRFLGKVSLTARKELEQNTLLQETLKEIGMSQLSKQKKEKLYYEFYSLTKSSLGIN